MPGLPAADIALSTPSSKAAYPLLSGPTFPDANWVGMGGVAGVNGQVRSAVMYQGALVIAGDFTICGTTQIRSLARWDGSAWSAFANGLDNTVSTLAMFAGDLYAGGNFNLVGTSVSASIAHAHQKGTTPQTISGTTLITATYGDAVTLVASASSGLPVQWHLDYGSAWLSGNVLHPTRPGTVTVYATQDGDATYASATYSSATYSSTTRMWATINVQPATLNVSATSTSRLFGAANPVFTGSLSGVVNRDLITATYASTATPVGTYGSATAQAIMPSLVDAYHQQGNSTILSSNGTLRITGVTAQAITFSDPGTVTYGMAPLTLSATSSRVLTVTLSVVSGPATLAGGVLTITGAGAVVVAAHQAGDSTYQAAPTVTRTIVVQPAVLQVTAMPTSRPFGAANPSFTGTITGAVHGDVFTATFASTAGATTAVGVYGASTAEAITPSVVDANGRLANYTVTLTKGALTIIGTQTITFPDPGVQTYGVAFVTLTATSSSQLPVTY